MPKKSRKKVVKKSRDLKQRIHWGESYTSFIIGVIVVIVVCLFGILFFRHSPSKHTPRQEVSSTFTENLPNFKVTPAVAQPIPAKETKADQTYTVKSGDDLWTISEKVYKSGYNWTDIAKANNLENPGLIFSGTVLKLSNVEPKVLTTETSDIATTTVISSKTSITADTYTIEKGDTIWDISVRAYGDGFRYMDIVKANNLENPDLIFSDNVLKIPR